MRQAAWTTVRFSPNAVKVRSEMSSVVYTPLASGPCWLAPFLRKDLLRLPSIMYFAPCCDATVGLPLTRRVAVFSQSACLPRMRTLTPWSMNSRVTFCPMAAMASAPVIFSNPPVGASPAGATSRLKGSCRDSSHVPCFLGDK